MNRLFQLLFFVLLAGGTASAQVLVYQHAQVGSVFDVVHDSSFRRNPALGQYLRRSYLLIEWKPTEGANLNQKLAVVDFYTTVDVDGFIELKYAVNKDLRYRLMDPKVNVGVNPLATTTSGGPNTYNTLNSSAYETPLNPASPLSEYCQIQIHPKGFIQVGGDGRITGISTGTPIPRPLPPSKSSGLGITRQSVSEGTTGTTTTHEADVWSLFGESTVLSASPLVIAPLKMTGKWQVAFFEKTGTNQAAPTASRHYVATGDQTARLDRKFTSMTSDLNTVLDKVIKSLRDAGYHLE
ncbi:MAG: hypothetical protein JNJ83_02375 [Verrucomicrobiaceae bacterium]|nr:hypothetical protein [Verrucomicrobiaceae bacterium]